MADKNLESMRLTLHAEVERFYSFWVRCYAKDPANYPLIMDEEAWWEQYEAFISGFEGDTQSDAQMGGGS